MGLNFSTCTIVNSMTDQEKGHDMIWKEGDNIRIGYDFNFDPNCIKSIKTADGYDAQPCVAVIDFGKLGLEEGTHCRLDAYVTFVGAEPSYGANAAHIQKGVPFWVEFTYSKNSASDVAKAIKKNHLFLIDEDILTVSVEGNVLTLTGAIEYARFKDVKVVSYDIMGGQTVVASLGKEGAIVLDSEGKNGFGTYSQIVKDLRVPTAANYQWTHLRQAETPVVGAIYDQFIIEYCAPASNDGTIFVGHRGDSWTTHVFWVKEDISAEFAEKLGVTSPEEVTE